MFLNPVYPEWFLLCHHNQANVTKSNVSAQDIFGAKSGFEQRVMKIDCLVQRLQNACTQSQKREDN